MRALRHRRIVRFYGPSNGRPSRERRAVGPPPERFFVVARRLRLDRTAADQEPWRAIAALDDATGAVRLSSMLHGRAAGKACEWEAQVAARSSLRPKQIARYEAESIEASCIVGKLHFLKRK